MQRRLRSVFKNAQQVRVRVLLQHGLDGPPLPLTVEHSDMVFVLKVKVEVALRLLRETVLHGSTAPLPAAEDIELEFRGVPLRDMMAIDRYGIETGSELIAHYVPQMPERDVVPRDDGFVHMEELIMAEPGVPSTGTIKRILSRVGKLCQVCWRGRWFRAEILSIYSTSLLLAWHDWPDAQWPNFFVRVALASAPNTPPKSNDETWRLRWHLEKPTRELPVVQPRFSQLPPLNWVKAFLRTYASSDETQILRELQAQLPRELIEARQAIVTRHHCLVLGASGVGKSTLVATMCNGPPASSEMGGGLPKYWPTVGTKCREATVSAPGLAPLPLQMYDTSGNARFKPLSLVFYRQAHSVILVFDVKSAASFQALSQVGGWLHEFTRLTGHTPHNFPFVLVGNKAEPDLAHHRQVYDEDVREWLYKEGGRMPYIETSFGGDPTTSWRHAEHVFRTVARTAHRVKENLGKHRPPETVRVAEEPDYVDERPAAAGALGSFFRGRSGSSRPSVSLAERLSTSVSTSVSTWAAKAGDDLWRGLENLQEKLPKLDETGGKRADCLQRTKQPTPIERPSKLIKQGSAASAAERRSGVPQDGRQPLVPLPKEQARLHGILGNAL